MQNKARGKSQNLEIETKSSGCSWFFFFLKVWWSQLLKHEGEQIQNMCVETVCTPTRQLVLIKHAQTTQRVNDDRCDVMCTACPDVRLYWKDVAAVVSPFLKKYSMKLNFVCTVININHDSDMPFRKLFVRKGNRKPTVPKLVYKDDHTDYYLYIYPT